MQSPLLSDAIDFLVLGRTPILSSSNLKSLPGACSQVQSHCGWKLQQTKPGPGAVQKVRRWGVGPACKRGFDVHHHKLITT